MCYVLLYCCYMHIFRWWWWRCCRCCCCSLSAWERCGIKHASHWRQTKTWLFIGINCRLFGTTCSVYCTILLHESYMVERGIRIFRICLLFGGAGAPLSKPFQRRFFELLPEKKMKMLKRAKESARVTLFLHDSYSSSLPFCQWHGDAVVISIFFFFIFFFCSLGFNRFESIHSSRMAIKTILSSSHRLLFVKIRREKKYFDWAYILLSLAEMLLFLLNK